MKSETLIGSFAIGAAVVLGFLLGVVTQANAYHERGVPTAFVACDTEWAMLKAVEILKERQLQSTDFEGGRNGTCRGLPAIPVTTDVKDQLTQLAAFQPDFDNDMFAPFEMDLGEEGTIYVLVWLPIKADGSVPGQDS